MRGRIVLFFFVLFITAGASAATLDEAIRSFDDGRYPEAAQQLQLHAEQGNATAQQRLAILYFYGRGVPEDEKKAMEWAIRSAGQGNPDAMYLIGTMYMFGDDVPKSVEAPDLEAAKWFFEGASRGHAESEYGLGLLFLAGKGVVQDQNEAMKWIRRAADHGHPSAQSFLSSGHSR